MAEEICQIFVSLPTNDVCTVRGITLDMKIFQLKSRIELKTGVPGDIQHLYFMNKELYDDLSLKDTKLKQGCIVRLKLDTNWESLFDACWRGDIYEVFENGVQFLDEREFRGYNIALWNRLVIQRANHALFIASHRGYLGLVIEILNRSAADINGKTRFGRTALHVAAYQGFVGCVSLLLSEGALCNQVDFNGKTALALASENGHIYCERRLWLYQVNLKAFTNQTDSMESINSQETHTNGFKLRSSKRNSGKTLSFNENLRGKDTDENGKRIHLRLPHVQISNGLAPPTSSSKRNEQSNSQFPLVQIAEKYREQLQNLDGNLPVVKRNESTQRDDLGPQTAPSLSRLNEDEQEAGAEDAVAHVQSANCTNVLVNVPDSKLVEASEDSERIVPCEEKKTTNSTMHSPEPARENMPKIDNEEVERPTSAKPQQIRKLDLVMAGSRDRTKPNFGDETKEYENYGPPRNPDNSNSEVFIDVSEFAYRRRKPAQTFDHWLEMKRSQHKLRPSTTNSVEKSKLGKVIDPDAFKQWLNRKRHNHSRGWSESSSANTKKSYISTGLSFDGWLESKTKAGLVGKRPSHVTELDEHGGNIQRTARVVVAGKTYEEWLNEKLKQVQANQNNESEEGSKNASKSGKSFEVWLLEKRKQNQIDMIHKATTAKLEQKRLEFEQYQRYLNPNYKTFDEWLAFKKHQHLIERFRAETDAKKPEEITKEDKEKDANLVFDIWLTMKYVQEMKEEEDKYKEMVEKWERKEQQRAQLRRLMLANKAKNSFKVRDKLRHVRAKSADY